MTEQVSGRAGLNPIAWGLSGGIVLIGAGLWSVSDGLPQFVVAFCIFCAGWIITAASIESAIKTYIAARTEQGSVARTAESRKTKEVKDLTFFMGDKSDDELWGIVREACWVRTDTRRAYEELRARDRMNG